MTEEVTNAQEMMPAEMAAFASPRSFFAFKGVFSGEYTGVRGACLFIVDQKGLKLERLYVIISGDGDEFKYQTKQEWKAFESSLITTKLQGAIAHQTTIDVQAYMKKVLQDDILHSLIEAARHDLANDIRRIVSDIISRAIADSQILLQMEVEQFQESVVGAEPGTAEESGGPAPDAGAAQQTAVQPQIVKVKVDPVLSPVQGVAAKSLLPGMSIMVEVRDMSAVKQNAMKMLLAKPGSGGKNNVLEGRVVSIEPAEYERVSIVTQLAQNIHGISIISGELRVKVSDNAKKYYEVMSGAPSAHAGPAMSSRAFFWSVVTIIGIMLLLGFLVFGGYIGG